MVVFATLALAEADQTAKWWTKTGGMRTVSPSCFSLGIDRLMQLVDTYADQGVKVFSINAVYDSGSDASKDPYDTYDLWCGLAAGDLSLPNKAIGTIADIQRLADHVHSRDMKFVSWYNPSYFWTGSILFQQAEREVAEAQNNGCNFDDGNFYGCLPADSSANWFKWCGETCYEGSNIQPDDAKPDPPGHPGAGPVNAWVWSEVAGAWYYSYWANQPTTDWSSPTWQSAFANATRYLIKTMRLDGFVFDDPDGYQGAGAGTSAETPTYWGADPMLVQKYITGVVHSIGDELGRDVAAFAEVYSSDFDNGENFAYDYGFDGLISDYGDQWRATTINQAVLNSNSVDLENAFCGEGGPDAYAARSYFSPEQGAVVAWDRRVVHTSFLDGEFDVAVNNHNCMLGFGATYAKDKGVMQLDACFQSCEADDRCDAITVHWKPELIGKPTDSQGVNEIGCFLSGHITLSECAQMPGFSTFDARAVAAQRLVLGATLGGGILAVVDQGGDGLWWSEAPYPGSQGDEIAKSMYSAVERSRALHHGTLRMTLENSGDHVAMLRYDAKHEGAAALVLLNMVNQRREVTVDLTLLREAYGQEPVNLITTGVSAPLEQSYTVEMEPFGVQMLELQLPAWDHVPGHKNCHSMGHGCIDEARCPSTGTGPLLLSECFLECINNEEFACEAVTVEWLLDGFVTCYKRGPILVDLCHEEPDASFSSFTLQTPSAPSIVLT